MGYERGRSLPARLLVLAVLTAAAIGVFGAGTAAAATPRALINGDTVSGGAGSIEAQQAQALGFAVDVVSGSTWDSMSQAQFAQYQVLVVGDPTCSYLAGSVTSNASTWAPVVMGTAGGNTQAGNRILIGTDPVFHYNYGHPGALHLIHDGIAFAGAQPGRTGLYFDDTCGDYFSSPSVLSVLASLSTGSGSWSENHSPPCGGSASLIASNPAFSTLSSGDLQGWYCSIHESFPTYPSDWSPLAIATDAPTHPTCGNDVDTGAAACGEAYILIAGSGIVVSAPDISVTPTDQTLATGGSATVTAHVEQDGSPLAGQAVTWTVTGQNAGATGTCVPADCTTDANGDVSFTYNDANGAGDDTVVASFTTSGGSFEQASGAVHWVGVAEQPISASGVDVSASEGAAFSGTVATVTDPDTTTPASDLSATIDWGDGNTSAGTVSGSGGSYTVSGDHTYADEGSYTVTITVTDVDSPDNTATATSTATVDDPALSATGTTITSFEGNSFLGTVATFSDPNTTEDASHYTATIDWGDGNTSAGAVTGSNGSFSVGGSHTYAEDGSYSVTVTIADTPSNTAMATTAASVSDAPLSAAGGAGGSTLQSYSGTVATFTDGNPSAPVSDFAASIDWGDGNTSTGTVSASGGGFSVAGSHTYAGTGYFTVTTTITDEGGSTATASMTLLVYAFAGTGAFVVGDQSDTGSVTFWGAQWAKANSISGGAASSSFKGYADNVTGSSWSTAPGNSSQPPAGPLPAYMGVIVTSSTSKSGSTISGNVVKIVVVQTNGGYDANPGHPGTGIVVAGG